MTNTDLLPTQIDTCLVCDGELVYLKYTVRVGGSDPMHAFRCKQCIQLQYRLSAPPGPDAVRLSNN